MKLSWIQPPRLPHDERDTADPALRFDGGLWVWTDEGHGSGEVPAGEVWLVWDVELTRAEAASPAHVAAAGDTAFELHVNGSQIAREATWSIGVCQALPAGRLRAGRNRLVVSAVNAERGYAGLCVRLGVAGRVLDLDDSARWAPASPPPEAGWRTSSASEAWRHAAVVARVGDPPWGVPEARVKRLPPPALLRREFRTEGVTAARLTVTALGLVRVTLDGEAITDACLLPGWTDYRQRVLTRTFDVSEQLAAPGDHALGLELADGWYAGFLAMNVGRDFYGNRPKVALRLELDDAGGGTRVIETDESWRCGLGGIREADYFNGYRFDATAQPGGWDGAGFDDATWSPAEPAPAGSIPPIAEPHPGPPVRELMTVEPVSVEEARPGVWRIDFGQNLVGHVRFRTHASAGRVVLRFAEMLNPDGSLYTTALRGARCTDTFERIGPGVWEPRFTFHGFRYAEVEGLPAAPVPGDLQAVVIGSDVPETGAFSCDHPALQRLFDNARWSQRGNFIDLPTDCPQRDERAGWTGDAQVFLPTAAWNADVSGFFDKWLTDVVDAQREDGAFSDIAPNMVAKSDPERFGNAGWGDAGILCPHRLWWVSGGTDVVVRMWPAMRRHMEFLLGDRDADGLRHAGIYGDWLNQDGGTDRRLIGTAYLARCARAMAEMAAAIGEDPTPLAAAADDAAAAFRRAFVGPDGAMSGTGLTGYALAVAFGLLDPATREGVASRFAEAAEEAGCRVVTGFLGTPVLLPALSAIGRSDLAWRVLLGEDFPSWLFTVKLGATTTWERWDGYHPERGPGNPAMNSFNHYAYGSVVQWYYEGIAGITPTAPGFASVRIAPQLPPPGAGPDRAEASFQSVRGRLAVAWERGGHAERLRVEAPAAVAVSVDPFWREASGPGEGVRCFEREAGAGAGAGTDTGSS